MKKHRMLFLATGLLFIGASLLLCARYSHLLIQAIYEGRSTPFLNSLIEGQQTEPLKTYLQYGDALIFTLVAFFLAVLVFYSQRDFFRQLPEQGQWAIAGILAFLLVAGLELRPEFKENELVKLIPIRMLEHPGLFHADWSLQGSSFSNFVFDWLVNPVALILSDFTLVMGGRILAWTLVTIAMTRFGRALGLESLGFILAFAFWFYSGQSLAGGETILGPFEPKPFSYAFLFFALTSLLREEVFKTALFCGLSILFHLLVGGWGAFGLLVAWCFSTHSRRTRAVLFLGLAVFLFSIPQLFTAGVGALKGGLPDAQGYAIRALFREPHHMDPNHFLSEGQGLEILLYFILTILLLWKAFPGETARKLTGFLASGMGVFVLGYGARQIEAFPFLFLYPFRVGPTFLLLLFSLASFHFLRVYGKTASLAARSLCLFVSFFVLVQAFHRRIPQTILKGTAGTFLAWRQYVERKGEDDFQKAAEWIQKNTPPDSVFVAPPWEYRFWLFTRRAQVVSFKVVPMNRTLNDWYERLVNLNAGLAFQRIGSGVLEEFRRNYPRLTAVQLADMRKKYFADYYLTTQPRPELPFLLRYSNDSYFLYDLRSRHNRA